MVLLLLGRHRADDELEAHEARVFQRPVPSGPEHAGVHVSRHRREPDAADDVAHLLKRDIGDGEGAELDRRVADLPDFGDRACEVLREQAAHGIDLEPMRFSLFPGGPRAGLTEPESGRRHSRQKSTPIIIAFSSAAHAQRG